MLKCNLRNTNITTYFIQYLHVLVFNICPQFVCTMSGACGPIRADVGPFLPITLNIVFVRK